MELRASVRFPVRMSVKIQTDTGRETAETVNVSASGVLLAFSRVLDAGSPIEIEMIMPSNTMGTSQDVVVYCHGRVIRSYRKSSTLVEVATVIDTYQIIS
ncbi:MAG TPA: PilZ domain-containing protein [Acidobacteriaceae bacterium]|nr:PilZ domain-containing protein [Acidobacteriaceae bacterium]